MICQKELNDVKFQTIIRRSIANIIISMQEARRVAEFTDAAALCSANVLFCFRPTGDCH